MLLSGALSALAAACAPAPAPAAAAPPPPAPVTSTTTAEPAPAPPPAPSASAAAAPEPPPAASAEPTPEPPARRAQTATEILTARDAAFLIDYSNSGARERAEADCDKDAKDDPAVKGRCLEKARDKFTADVLRFNKKDSQGHWQLAIYKRQGSRLDEIYVGSVEFSEESGDSIRLKFTGREKGVRPLFRGQSVAQISIPNEYSVEIEDPAFGHLTYNAKIGLVSE